MAKKINLDILIQAAKELNEVITCDPPICVVAEEENRKAIEAGIIECSDLITPDDEVSPKTKKVIAFLLEGAKEEEEVSPASKKKSKEPEKKSLPVPAAKPKAPAAVTKKEEKPVSNARFSKVSALKMALEAGDFTKDELLHKTIEIYEEQTGKEAGMVTISTLDVTLPVLTQFGAVVIKDGKYHYVLKGKK